MSKKSDQLNDQAFRCIETVLAHTRPKQDTRSLVETLRERFVTADALFKADAFMLEKNGVHPHDALLLSCMPSIARYIGRNSFPKSYKLDRVKFAGEYLTANFHGYQVEHFHVLHLDARGRLMERTALQEGTADCSLFNLRKLLSEIVRVSPKAVILSHNHPGGTLRPSQEDIDCTMDALRALTVVGIPMLDHIIIAGPEFVSLRENGFIPAVHWLSQSPDHRMLRNYLLPPDQNPPAPKRKKPK